MQSKALSGSGCRLFSLLLAFEIGMPIVALGGVEINNLGPFTYYHNRGKPTVYHVTFPGVVGTAVLHIEEEKACLSIIRLNGRPVAAPRSLKPRVLSFDVRIRLAEENAIEITLVGKPGSAVTLHVTQEVEAEAAAAVGPAGGSLTVEDPESPLAGTSLELPPGALSESAVVTLRLGDSARLQADLDSNGVGGTIVGPIVSIQAPSSELGAAASLTVPYNPELLPSGVGPDSLLMLRRTDEGVLEYESDDPADESPQLRIDTQNHTLSVMLRAFSEHGPVVAQDISGRIKGVANVGCSSGGGPVFANLLDDQDEIGPILGTTNQYGLPLRTQPVSMIVIHSTDAYPQQQSLNEIVAFGYRNSRGPAQAHYYIDRDGTVYRLVAENYVAFHAGYPAGTNGKSIGIELQQHIIACAQGTPNCAWTDPCLPDSTCPGWRAPWENPPFTDAQYTALARVLGGLMERYPGVQVTYHKYLDHSRKADPRGFDPSRIAGASCTATPPCDPFLVPTFISPPNLATLSGTVPVACSLSPGPACPGSFMEFVACGPAGKPGLSCPPWRVAIGAKASPPFQVSWDTTPWENGQYAIFCLFHTTLFENGAQLWVTVKNP